MTEKQLAANRRNALKSTGPRTLPGKQRSKLNALKSGIFSQALLLKGEDSRAHSSLLRGLIEDLMPQGTLEVTLVETLAMIIWRKRRFLHAERAEIGRVVESEGFYSRVTQASERWDLVRAAGTSGGMLRNSSNPFVIRESIETLKICRNLLDKFGFQKGEDPWRLRRLYGLDVEGFPPPGIFRTYKVYSILATDPPKGMGVNESPDELKKQMIGIFEDEIERLTLFVKALDVIDAQRIEYQTAAALVPSPEVSGRLIRCEAHLSREFDRTLSQLERVQRARLGKPEPPRVVVGINAQTDVTMNNVKIGS